jgi:tetratricopeptide (TPR) repeat protein
VYDSLGRYEEARSDRGIARSLFDEKIEKNPREYFHWAGRGLLSKGEGNYAAALEDYSHSIAIKPTDADVYRHCGDAHVGMGEYDRGL